MFLNQDTSAYQLRDLIPTCGRTPDHPASFWRDFLCEPRDKLLQSMAVSPDFDGLSPVPLTEYEYLCNETNILDRLFKAYDYYRNPEVGQTRDCLWECCADQLNRALGVGGSPLTTELVKGKCLDWLRRNAHHRMGPDCSLPVAEPVPDDGCDHGTRCTLGEYVQARWGLEWTQYVDMKMRGCADPLCLWAVAEVFGCIIFVCSKTFPYPDFFVKFGQAGPSLLLGHWQKGQHFFRSLIGKDDWDTLYKRARAERGLRYWISVSRFPPSHVLATKMFVASAFCFGKHIDRPSLFAAPWTTGCTLGCCGTKIASRTPSSIASWR
jgi:hypothetical protein